MIDCHCHLNDQTFTGELGLTAIITASDSLISSERAIKLAERYENIYACIGLGYSPKNIDRERARQKLMRMAKDKKVVGFGEIGINQPENEKEWEWFDWQVRMARELELPMIVHNRKADKEILERLKNEDKVMLHCFTGEMEFMQECVKRGWYISFGGIITFKQGDRLREVVRQVPEDNIVAETDAPYLAPEPLRGSQNKPANVKIVLQTMAKIRDVSEEKMDYITTANAKRLFKI